MSDSSSFLVEKLALQYDIDPYTANICIQEALSKILEKEVISTDSGYAYYSTARSIFVNVRITKSMTKRIKYLFEKEVRSLKNKRLKDIYYMPREFKIFKCKVIYQNVDWFEIVEVKNQIRGRVYFDNLLETDNVKVTNEIVLKLKSLIKVKGYFEGVFTRKEPLIYTKIVYSYIDNELIQKIKIDFKANSMVIKYKNTEDLYTSDMREKLYILKKHLPFKILTK
ncbi:hypothetical protein [Aliarcobacter butzleri]|uniref:hypothetical protein n=1 Tax=Aliarcobacter butzleri TaxID=28197 RepID=UPI00125FC320|nr:hypothetical protein [Aliarcobacter butzleri]